MLLNATLLWKGFLKESYAALPKDNQPTVPLCLLVKIVPRTVPWAVA